MGKIELDHTGSGSGITLSSDGTSLLLDGTAVGGGADLYAANPVSATNPTAQGDNSISIGSGANDGSSGYDNAIAIGTSALAEAARSVSIGKSTNSGTDGVGIGTNAHGGGSTATAVGAHTDARSVYATAIGAWAQAWTGWGATAIAKSYASGTDSLAAVITNNSSSYGATGANSIAMGKLTKATAASSVAVGESNTANSTSAIAMGYNSTASASYATCIGRSGTASGENASSLGGRSGLATGESSTTVGGRSNKAYADYAVAMGYWTYANKIGQFSYASGRFSGDGDAQTSKFVLRSDTTDATAEALTTNNSTASTDNQVVLPNNSAFAFHGTIVARQQAADGTACAAWKVEGLIRREGSAGTTVLVNSATTVLDNTPSWGMALSADTTNGGLAITVTGAASTDIRWVATIHTSEVTYA